MTAGTHIGAVIIGRNEGERLRQCLKSVHRDIQNFVYVDSGSDDDSLEIAKAAGAQIVELDMSQPITAARARNIGFEALLAKGPIDYVQFIDGDCELAPNWVTVAHQFLEVTPNAVVACGRRRERFPEASIYNRLCDREWNTPIGQVRACGGDALMRVDAFQAVGGFNPTLIAGEEPELCVRLRQQGSTVWRLDHEMTLHDAAMTRFSQWWKRSQRAGHAYAEGAVLHGAAPERHGLRPTLRALFWGACLPLLIVLLALFGSGWALLLALAYPAQILRLAVKDNIKSRAAWQSAWFLMLGKFPEVQGIAQYFWRRLSKKERTLIEYK